MRLVDKDVGALHVRLRVVHPQDGLTELLALELYDGAEEAAHVALQIRRDRKGGGMSSGPLRGAKRGDERIVRREGGGKQRACRRSLNEAARPASRKTMCGASAPLSPKMTHRWRRW